MLSEAMLAEYRSRGRLTIPQLISAHELARLKQAALALAAGPALRERIVEPDGSTVRTVFNAHELHPYVGELITGDRMVGIVEALLQEKVYVLQSQLNPKPAFDTVLWRWHSDYLFWHTRDGMREPRALTATVYLDDVTIFNGPILAIPGSHRLTAWEVAEEGDNLPCGEKNANADPSRKVIRKLADENGLEFLTGSAGSVLFLDAQVLHCSTANQSPYDRGIVIARYNSVMNPLPDISQPRPEWKVRRRP